ncbi:MAG: InlB B-repeat-containing protein [Atopobiaceae bacterium]|nr:InlB B-repeat-containing protein [Atopobiaceae bacterium]
MRGRFFWATLASLVLICGLIALPRHAYAEDLQAANGEQVEELQSTGESLPVGEEEPKDENEVGQASTTDNAGTGGETNGNEPIGESDENTQGEENLVDVGVDSGSSADDAEGIGTAELNGGDIANDEIVKDGGQEAVKTVGESITTTELPKSSEPIALASNITEASRAAEARRVPAATAATPKSAQPVLQTQASRKTYKVTFYDAFGNVAKVVKVKAGGKAKAPKLAKALNRKFLGWDIKFNKVTKNLHVHPKYRDAKKSYVFSWNVSGSVINWFRAKKGVKVSLEEYWRGNYGYMNVKNIKSWNTKPDGSGTSYAPDAVIKTPARDVALYAMLSKKQKMVKVTLKPNRGTGYNTTLYVPAGEKTSVLNGGSPTTDDGYALVGYATKKNAKKPTYAVNSTIKPKRNMTLYGVWKKAKSPLRFKANYAGGTDTTTYLAGGYTYSLEDGEIYRDGYTLVGWNTKKNGKGTKYNLYADKGLTEYTGAFTKLPSKGLTLYARWKKLPSRKLTYNYNMGAKSYTYSDTYHPGTKLLTSSYANGRDGYALVGWNTKKNGKGTTYATRELFTMPKKKLTLYAQWKKANSVVTYDYNYKGATKNVYKKAEGSVAHYSSYGYREGYSLVGWNTKKNGKGMRFDINASCFVPKGRTTLYAQWKKLPCVTFKANYVGAGDADSKQYGTAGDERTISTDHYREGYSLLGYTTKSNGKGKMYRIGATYKFPKKNLALYAKWGKNNVNVNLVGNYKGAKTSTTKAAAGAKLTSTNVDYYDYPYRDDYSFAGWNTKANGKGTHYTSDDFNDVTVPKKGLTLYAEWVKNPVVTFVANNGTKDMTSVTDRYVYMGTRYYAKAGKAMANWNTKANGKGTSFSIGENVNNLPSNLKVFAQWKKPTAKIVLKGNHAGVKDQTVGVIGNARNGYDLPDMSDTARDYFYEWNTKANGKGEHYSSYSQNTYIPKKGLTLYAIWKPKKVLTLNPNGGSGGNVITYERPDSYVWLGDYDGKMTRPGYTQVGWSTNPSATYAEYGVYGSFYLEDTNATLYAVWEQNA